MTPGARLAAASEVLAEVLERRNPADRALQHWGRMHRFAGSKDRAAIAERVYTVIRRLGECERVFANRSPRSLVLGSLVVEDGLNAEQAAALAVDGTHALGSLSAQERQSLESACGRAADSALNFPKWLEPQLTEAFGGKLQMELAALNARAPVDVRVNTLKASRDEIIAELRSTGLSPQIIEGVPAALRFPPETNLKLQTLPCYLDGRVEVQDASSQMAIAFAAPVPGEIAIDLAAGAGGKALAMAAAMQNRGSVFMCDVAPERLALSGPRVQRSGATIIAMAGSPYQPLITKKAHEGADLVFVDAPCSGSGTWRRNPEAKWTLTSEMLDAYLQAQRDLLKRATELVRDRGRIVYAVCSVLPCEAERQVQQFCAQYPVWRAVRRLQLSPASTQTDGFFAAEIRRV